VETKLKRRLLVGCARVGASDARGYTPGMKTAVSVPNKVFRAAERLAKRARKSRSQLYSEALSEYLIRHSPDEVTEAMNRALEQIGDASDPFVTRAARAILERTEW
jgi:metal-responsive CopG/Arc/MetJ family transcriptional regulator